VTTRTTLAAAGLLCLVAAAAADPPTVAPPPRPVGGEPFDVACLTDTRPVVVRLRITAEGRPLDQSWARFVDALFNYLDTDHNASLDAKEAARLQPVLTLLTGRSNFSGGLTAPLSRDRLAEYLRQNDLGPFRVPTLANPNQPRQRRVVQAGTTAPPETTDKALMDLLDTNKDGKLDRNELAAAETILSKLDDDENELISIDELLRRPGPLPFFVEEPDDRPSGRPGLEMISLRKGPDAELARRLLARYGTKPGSNPTSGTKSGGTSPKQPNPPSQPAKRRLTRDDLGISPEAFNALDQDGDGELDTEELARFGQAPPDVEITLKLGAGPATAGRVQVAAARPPITAEVQGAAAVVEVSGTRLEWMASPSQMDFVRANLRRQYQLRFMRLDQDGNGYVDMNEARNDPVFQAVFPILDRDGDGKVFANEIDAAMNEIDPVAAEAARGVVSADVSEASRGLFGLIDTDGDGRLSIRELRAMPGLVDRFDRDKDGAISPAEVPRLFQVTLTPGAFTGGFGPPGAVVVRAPGGPMPARPPTGPAWFQKMDRNKDGVVSRREFLGTDEDFRRIDTNGDGLIDQQEAEAASNVKPQPQPQK
jgi:Ca2+-binding EF-hand superfamily protein